MIAVEFLTHAKKLIDPNNNPTEVDCRSAVSRAYYSLYHETKEALLRKNYTIPIHDSHKFISKTLFKKNKTIGWKYKSFRDDRNNADYNLTLSSFTQSSSEIKVKEMERLIQQVKTMLT